MDPKKIREFDKSHHIYTNIYLDKDKEFPLIEVYVNKTNVLHKFEITRFICIDGNWAVEVQSGEGSFYHKFKGVVYHRDFDKDVPKDGKLHLYIKDRKKLI